MSFTGSLTLHLGKVWQVLENEHRSVFSPSGTGCFGMLCCSIGMVVQMLNLTVSQHVLL